MSRPGDQREQDAAIEKLLKRQEGGSHPAGGPLCGDADLLAAYAERSLGGREREGFEQHLAACGACREAVARLVRLAPPSAAVVPIRPARAWWTPWAWAAPALAGLVLVGSLVWYERGRILEPPEKPVRPMAKAQQPPQAQPARPPAPPVAGAEVPAKQPAEKDQFARARANVPGRPAVKRIPPSGTAAEVAGRPSSSSETYAPVPAAAPEPAQDRTEAKEEQAATLDRRLAKREKADAARDEAAATIARENARAMDSKTVGGVSSLTAKPGAAGGAPRRAAIGRLPAEGAVIQRQRLIGTQQVWALIEDGRLFHSSDAGQTWQAVEVPERLQWFSFASEKSGKILGRSGDPYATEDGGKTWKSSNE